MMLVKNDGYLSSQTDKIKIQQFLLSHFSTAPLKGRWFFVDVIWFDVVAFFSFT
jgi:hypothetical protein